MKSHWIAAAVVLSAAWPLSSKAYLAGVDQSQADEKPTQQVQSSDSSTHAQAQDKTQEPSGPAQTTVPTNAAVNSQGTANPQTKNSYMLVELSRSLKAKKLKAGDKVKAQVAQDVIAHGKVIIPVETELVGHVSEVCVRDRENAESRLGIVFDRILLKHFHDINVQAVVQAVAPPVVRMSRVDQPSQMLPPSMVGGGIRNSAGSSVGRSSSPSVNRPGSGSSSAISGANSATTFQVPLTVTESPSTHAATGSSAAQLKPTPSGNALSVGMPQGVVGLKGLGLSSTPSPRTPGPVIVSSTDNVKLESGTQILLRVMTVEMPK
jgi:hypothetical protein